MNTKLEPTFIEGSQPIELTRYCCVPFNGTSGWNLHSEYELTLVLKGKGKRLVGDCVETFQPGDLVFIAPNVPHFWESDNASGDNEIISLRIQNSLFENAFFLIPEANILKHILSDSKRGILYSAKDIHGIASLFLEAEKSSGLKQLSSVMSLLDTLCQHQKSKTLLSEYFLQSEPCKSSARLLQVLHHINSNLHRELRQTELAELTGIRTQSFSRYFKATTGCTFTVYVNKLRIKKACNLLKNSDLNVSQIAKECGFSSISNFNRRFLDVKNCTPRKYRSEFRRFHLHSKVLRKEPEALEYI